MKHWQSIAIALLLVAVTFLATRNYRLEQILTLQEQFNIQNNGIAKTTQILQEGLNSGQVNIDALRSVGWNISVPQPNEDNPSK